MIVEARQHGSNSEYVYAELKRKILSLELSPGTRLYEPALATSLNVSRTPLREALRQLLTERLLDRLPTGGLAVPHLDAKEIAELYSVRAALESLMAAEACRLATAADIAALEDIVAKNAALVDFPDEAMAYGKALHAAIGRIASNSWASRLYEQVSSQMERYRRFTNESEQRRATALADHRVLVALIAGNDPEAAAAHASQHAKDAGDEALRAIERAELLS